MPYSELLCWTGGKPPELVYIYTLFTGHHIYLLWDVGPHCMSRVEYPELFLYTPNQMRGLKQKTKVPQSTRFGFGKVDTANT